MSKYDSLILSEDQIKNSINLQVLAHHNPKRINWPSGLWVPKSPLDKILKEIRDGNA